MAASGQSVTVLASVHEVAVSFDVVVSHPVEFF